MTLDEKLWYWWAWWMIPQILQRQPQNSITFLHRPYSWSIWNGLSLLWSWHWLLCFLLENHEEGIHQIFQYVKQGSNLIDLCNHSKCSANYACCKLCMLQTMLIFCSLEFTWDLEPSVAAEQSQNIIVAFHIVHSFRHGKSLKCNNSNRVK